MKKINLMFKTLGLMLISIVSIYTVNAAAILGNDQSECSYGTDPTFCSTDPTTVEEPKDSDNNIEGTIPTTHQTEQQNNYADEIERANLYINYESTQGHKIHSQVLYKGKAGEVVNLSQYQKAIKTFVFDHYKPSNGSLVLQAGKYSNATLVYRKVTPEKKDSSYTENTTTNNKIEEKSDSTIESNTSEKQAIKGIFDDYFSKNRKTKEEKRLVLSAIKITFEKAKTKLSSSEEHYKNAYNMILEVIENYPL